MKYLSISIIISFAVFSCKKEDICILNNHNHSIIDLDWKSPECSGDFEVTPTNMEEIIHLGNQFSSPAFNPNNPYEFCFYQIVADSGSQIAINHRIVTFNLQTGTKKVILNDTKVSGNLAWNKQGWIAYQDASNGAMYAINANTQEIKQMSIIEGYPIDKNLTWINGSDSLIWGGADINMVPYIKFNKIDSDEEEEILVYGEPASIYNEFTISSKNELLARGQHSLNSGCEFYKVHFDEILESWNSFTIPLNGSKFGRVNWHVDGNNFYVPMTYSVETAGLFEVNYNTLEIEKLYSFCEKQFIYQAVCSPNGKYLLIQKFERDYIIDEEHADDPFGMYNQIVENSKLWLYDLTTNKETLLPLD